MVAVSGPLPSVYWLWADEDGFYAGPYASYDEALEAIEALARAVGGFPESGYVDVYTRLVRVEGREADG